MATERTGPSAVRRIPPLLRFVLVWAAGIPAAWAARLLFDPAEPWAEKLLGAAMFSLAMTPAFSGGPHLWQRQTDDERALRRAVRRGSPPADERLRAALPAHLAWLRRGARYGLTAGLLLCGSLAAVGVRYADDPAYPVFFVLVAAVLVALAARTLVRVRRLARAAPPGQGA